MKFNSSKLSLVWPWLIFSILFLIFIKNIKNRQSPPPLTIAKAKSFSFSRGDSYFGRLQLWRYFILHNDWNQASLISSYLDPADTAYHLSLYSPQLITESLNQLIFKSNKTTDDYLEMARSYSRLGDYDQAREAIFQAYQLDPIREDVSRLYYLLAR